MSLDKGTRVRAKVDSKRGNGEDVVPKGTLGKVLGNRGDTTLVKWDGLKPAYYGDWGTSVHSIEEIEALS